MYICCKINKMPGYITDKIEIFYDDSERKNSDDENSNEKIFMKKILIKKIKYKMWIKK